LDAKLWRDSKNNTEGTEKKERILRVRATSNYEHSEATTTVKMLNQSRYRPGVAQRVPGSYLSQIS